MRLRQRRPRTVIPVVIFTFGPDGPCALECAGAALDSGLGPVFVFDDIARALGGDTAAALRSLGVRVATTGFPRGGNLRGRAAIAGMASCYRRALAETGANWLIKLDSDTILHRPERISDVMAGGACLASWDCGGTGVSGSCMALSGGVVSRLEHAAAGRSWPAEFSPANCPEDQFTLMVARHAGSLEIFPYHPSGGFGAGWRYGEATVPLSEYAKRFDCVTFGNRHLLTGSDCDRREQAASAMARFRSACRLQT